jgi:hypothetical protein
MLIEKQRHYKVIQSFMSCASCNENEFEVYDFNDNRVGYFIERDNQFEVYHNADSDYEDYTSIDYADNYDEALYLITSEINYDMN